MADYREMIDAAKAVRDAQLSAIKISYGASDRPIIDAVSLTKSRLSKKYGSVPIKLAGSRGNRYEDLLERGELDVIIDYNSLGASNDDPELCVTPLFVDPIVVALPKGRLPEGQSVSIEQICSRHIPYPTTSIDNYLEAVLGLFSGCPHTPTVRLVEAESIDEFFLHTLASDEMWLFSYSLVKDYPTVLPASYLETCTFHSIEGRTAAYARTAVYRKDNPNPMVGLFVEELAMVLGELRPGCGD